MAGLRVTGTAGQKTTSSAAKSADSGLRKQIQRLKKQRAAAPVDPYDAPALASAQLKYGPAERNLLKQARASRQQVARSDSWYDQYRMQVAQAGAQSVAAYQAANAQMVAQNQAAQVQSQGASDQALSQAGADAASRGASVDPSLGVVAAQAAAARRGSGQAAADALTTQGASAAQLAGQQGVAAAAAKLGGEREEQGRQRSIAEDMQLLKQQKGQYVVQAKSDAQDAAQKSALEAQAFGLDVAKENNDQSNAAADRRIKKLSVRLDQKEASRRDQIAQQNADANTTRANKPSESGSDGLTPAQRRAAAKGSDKAVTDVNTIAAKWNAYVKNGVPVTKWVKNDSGKLVQQPVVKGGQQQRRKPSPEELKAQLLKDGYDATAIHIALVVRAGKPLSPRDRRLAKQLGILNIPKTWKRGKQIAGSGGPNGDGTA